MTRKFEITDAKRGAAFTVRVVTRAQKNEIVGVEENNSLKIRLTSAANDQANGELIKFLAERLEVDTSAIEIVAGQGSRDKWISVSGISTADVETKLQADPGASDD
jgi:uncharacterized protein (TIGR00251 family)